MNDTFESPGFFSLDFHLRFLPGVIRQRLRPASSGSRFAPAGSVGFFVFFFLSVILLANGISGMAEAGPGSLVLTLSGGGGLLVLTALGAYWHRNVPTTYALFDPGIFFFVIVLGGTVGLWTAELTNPDRLAGIWTGSTMSLESRALENSVWTLGGLVAGYVAGVAAGLWTQRLGPTRVVLDIFAWPAIFGLIVTDGVLLSLN